MILCNDNEVKRANHYHLHLGIGGLVLLYDIIEEYDLREFHCNVVFISTKQLELFEM